MWKRSEVERLTGLTRHMIQDLCNPNTKGDGLGFWVPAVTKPGYSRFDEGDLLAFYLVRQLMKAGFTLKEVEPAVFGILEGDSTFADMIELKERRVMERRDKLDGNLMTLANLEEVAALAPDERLPTVMDMALEQSATRALQVAEREVRAAGEPVDEREIRRICERVQVIVAEVVLLVQGDIPKAAAVTVRDAVDEHQACDAFRALAEQAGQLIKAGEKPSGRAARAFAWQLAGQLADAHEGDAARYAMRALAHFLSERENGVPVELVLGNGSFAFLAQATVACVDELDSRNR